METIGIIRVLLWLSHKVMKHTIHQSTNEVFHPHCNLLQSPDPTSVDSSQESHKHRSETRKARETTWKHHFPTSQHLRNSHPHPRSRYRGPLCSNSGESLSDRPDQMDFYERTDRLNMHPYFCLLLVELNIDSLYILGLSCINYCIVPDWLGLG